MTSEQWTRVWEVFDRALERPPAERRDWLESICADEPAVRAEVESLLGAYDPDDPLFAEEGAFSSDWFDPDDATTEGRGDDGSVVRPGPNARIGGYRLLEEIGVGGMSDVYRAERVDEAVEQTVAVKLMRRQLRANEAEQRFRAERQVLASLDHPNIAQFIDGGVTEGGRPYLVMEYVDGTPITGYADARNLDVPARLDLLEQVLDAVQAAHRQLVVHRDLKPSNVLVTETEGEPTVKLLDFGIAKLLDDSLPVTRPRTQTGHLLMTPAYAAPEQVAGTDITTVTDVYQLGVLAYELLSGARPFDLEDRRSSEIETIIAGRMPDVPSQAATSPRAAALRGDLDQIVQKALRKEPERRYASVEALAADLGRYRRGKPVDAQPATLGYRARKFVERHRVGVSVGAAFAVIVAVLFGLLVRQQRITAAERDRAQEEAAQAEAVSQFLVDLFQAADPEEAQGDTVTAQTLLRRGAERVTTLEGQPQVQADLLHTLGRVHRRLGHLDRAVGLIEKSLSRYREEEAPTSPEYADALSELGLLLRDRGEYEQSASRLRKAVDVRRQMDASSSLATELMRLTYVERQLGNYEAARSAIEEAIAIQKREHGSNHMSTAESYFNLAAILRELGRYDEALQYQRQSLSIVQSKIDGPHPGLATNYSNLGLLLGERGEHEAAEAYYRKSLAMNRKLYGDEHRAVGTSLQNLGTLLLNQEQFEDAESFLQRALEIRQSIYDGPHPSIGSTFNSLGVLAEKQGHFERADSLLRASLSVRRSVHGETDPSIALTLKNLGRVYEKQGRMEEAGERYRAAISVYEESLPQDHLDLANAQSLYGAYLLHRNRFEAARPVLRSAYRVLVGDSSKPASTVRTARRLGHCLTALGRYEEAEAALTQGRALADSLGLSEALPKVRTELGALYEAWDKPAKAKRFRAGGTGEDPVEKGMPNSEER